MARKRTPPPPPSLSLSDWVARVGATKASRRFGVTPRTLQGWLKRGVSAKARPIVEAALRRSEASAKAAETRKRLATWQETLPVPRKPDADPQYPGRAAPLTPTQVLPKKPPRDTREGQKILKGRGTFEGSAKYNTERYIGEKQWITIGQPVTEVPLQVLIDQIVHLWHTNRRQWCFVNFLFFRQIPFNPLYQGELQNKQGKWVEIWHTSKTRGTASSIEDSIQAIFDGYIKRNQETGEVERLKGIYEMAESRFIWLEAMIVHTFSNKEDL